MKKKRRKKYNLDFYITKYSDIEKLYLIIKYNYDGKIPIVLYNHFYSRILDSNLKKYFIQIFSKIVTEDTKENNEKYKKEIIQSYVPKHVNNIDKNHNVIKNVYARDFSFKKSLYGPRIVYKNYESYFFGNSNWFAPEILNMVKRLFTIKLRSNGDFIFIPYEDKNELIKLLSDAYQITYSKALNECIDAIQDVINRRINHLISKYRRFELYVPIEKLVFDESRQVYTYVANIYDIKSINETIYIEISSTELFSVLSEEQMNRFYKELNQRWGRGFRKNYSINDFVPILKSNLAHFKIPSIVIERLSNDRYIKLIAVYYEEKGIYAGGVGVYYKGYSTSTLPVIFKDDIKNSLNVIIRQVDGPFMETFYTAFQYMFNEGDLRIKTLLDKYRYDCDILNHVEYDRYRSGYSELRTFDPDDKNDWMWLSSQIKNGKFEKAYSFFDMDETYSTKAEYINKSSVKVYIAVERHQNIPEIPFTFYFRLHLYSLDTSKSVYRFKVIPSMLNEAIFFVWAYFSSNNYNKRQDFQLVQHYQKLFGISDFEKDIPLKYSYGLGYNESNWI